MTTIPALTLNTGASMPQLGLGVYEISNAEMPRVVRAALAVGYRSIDTAALYGNERGVGRAIAEADVPRDELFVTTKLGNGDQGHDSALRAFEASLERLGLDHVDLYLIHWPLPGRDRYVESWKALERLHAEGAARAIGVSNFQIAHLERLFAEADVVPAVNQIELHPRLAQAELRAFHAEHGIVTEAWSPIGAGGDLLADPVLGEIAAARGVTPAQVVLRWHMQLGVVAIPKSASEARLAENADVFGFALDDAEMAAIARLDAGERTGDDPDTFDGDD